MLRGHLNSVESLKQVPPTCSRHLLAKGSAILFGTATLVTLNDSQSARTGETLHDQASIHTL